MIMPLTAQSLLLICAVDSIQDVYPSYMWSKKSNLSSYKIPQSENLNSILTGITEQIGTFFDI